MRSGSGGCRLHATDGIQETHHLLQVLFGIHAHAVSAFGNKGSLRLDTGSLQYLKELLALTAGDYVVFLTMEDDDGWRLGINIGGGTQAEVLVGFLREFGVQQHVLGRVVTHLHVIAAVHGRQVNGARPVAGSIDSATLAGVVTNVALQVDCQRAYSNLLLSAGSGSRRCQMSTAGETAGGNERRVELVLGSLTAYEANYSFDVVQLGRPLGIHAGTVVRTYYGIACIQQRFDDGAKVGHPLAAVVEPCAAVDVNNDRIGCLFFLGQIDIAGVVRLVVTCIVDVLPLL